MKNVKIAFVVSNTSTQSNNQIRSQEHHNTCGQICLMTVMRRGRDIQSFIHVFIYLAKIN